MNDDLRQLRAIKVWSNTTAKLIKHERKLTMGSISIINEEREKNGSMQ